MAADIEAVIASLERDYGPNAEHFWRDPEVDALIAAYRDAEGRVAMLREALRAVSYAKDVPLSVLQTEIGDALSAHYQRIADNALAATDDGDRRERERVVREATHAVLAHLPGDFAMADEGCGWSEYMEGRDWEALRTLVPALRAALAAAPDGARREETEALLADVRRNREARMHGRSNVTDAVEAVRRLRGRETDEGGDG